MDQVNCFKSCLPHISLGQFLNTLPHIYFFSGRVQQEVQFSSCHIITFVEILPCLKTLFFILMKNESSPKLLVFQAQTAKKIAFCFDTEIMLNNARICFLRKREEEKFL